MERFHVNVIITVGICLILYIDCFFKENC